MGGITRLLSKGIAHLTGGGSAEEYIGQVDFRHLSNAEQEELRTLLDTAAGLLQLRQVAIPTPSAKAANRARFLGQAVQLKEMRRRPVRWGWLRAPAQLWRGLLGAALALILVLAIGSGTVNAAASSLPGSLLYPLKLAMEDTRLFLAPSQATRAQLYLHFANERTTEMVRLVTAGRTVDQAIAARMARQLEGAVDAAEAAGDELARQLLEQVIATSTKQEEILRQASAQAKPEAQTVLNAGAAIADQAARQAQEALQHLIAPAATPTSTPTWTGTPTPVPSKPPVIAPADTATATATASPSHTPTWVLPSATPRWTMPVPTRTRSPTLTPTATPALPPTPLATATPTSTRRPTHTPSATVSPVVPTPSNTPEPTPTPRAVFSLIKIDHPDPVPATYRIHYDICVINEGEVPLTNVVIVDRWSPTECVYLPPDNPSEMRWVIGTVNAYASYCVHFALNTYSICGGYTVTNEAVMTCDQGTARAVQTTRIGPTPSPTATETMTATVTPTLTLTPELTLTPTFTPAPTIVEGVCCH